MIDSAHLMHLFLPKVRFNKKLLFQHIFEHQSMQHQKDKKHTPAFRFGANIIHSLMSYVTLYKKMAIEFFVQLQNCLLLCFGTGWRPF